MISRPWFVRPLPFGAGSARFPQCFRYLSARFANFAVLAILLLAVWNIGYGQQPLQGLQSHVRAEVLNRRGGQVGSLAYDRRLNLSIVLPLRNQAGLTGLLSRLYDPSSPDYRHFLSVAQFTEQFGPTVADYQAVVSFAESHGFTVTAAPENRLIVPVSGTVDQINRAFNITMNEYQHPTENRTFFSPDRESSLNLSVPVAHISGLNNFSTPHPMLTRAAAGQGIANVTGSGPGGSYLASDMRAAYYGGSALPGSGQWGGLFVLDGYNLDRKS